MYTENPMGKFNEGTKEMKGKKSKCYIIMTDETSMARQTKVSRPVGRPVSGSPRRSVGLLVGESVGRSKVGRSKLGRSVEGLSVEGRSDRKDRQRNREKTYV